MLSKPYHESVYDTSAPVQSYWEVTAPVDQAGYAPLQGEQSADVAVIGGGYTGLSLAMHLARDYGIDVRVLEAGHIGWGASGRNGGFCCLPATKMSIDQLISRYGLDETKRFYAAQLEGVDLVRALEDEEGIDFERRGDGNLEVAHKPSCFAELEQAADALQRLFGIKTTLYTKDAFAEVGHDSTEQFGAMHMAAGFGLHPLKLLGGLARAAARRGAQLHPRSEVRDWSRHDGAHVLRTDGGTLRARRVVLATNGFTPEGLHPAFDRMMLPAISNIITTRPLTRAELEAQSWRTECPVCNTRTLLFYYRMLPDQRFLFGARGDSTGRPEHGARMREWMVRRLRQVFPGWSDVPLSHYWRGLVCVTRKLAPSVGRLTDDPTVWYGFGYHANGVNTAPWVGMRLARAIAGSNREDTDIPAVMAGLAPRFPFAAIRLWCLRAAYVYYRVQDAR